MFIGSILIIAFILLDQLTKRLAIHFLMGLTHDIIVIPSVFQLSYYENNGASFGMLEGQMLFFMVVTLIALGIFGYLFLDSNFKNKKIYSLSIALMIAGTVGNAIDRLLYGYVVDFMHFPFLNVFAPAFYNNMADMYLSIGIVLFFIELFVLDSIRKKKEKNHQNIQG